MDETSASAPTALPGAPGSAAALASARAPGVRPAPSDAAGPPRRTVRFVEPGGAGPGPDGGPSSTSGMQAPLASRAAGAAGGTAVGLGAGLGHGDLGADEARPAPAGPGGGVGVGVRVGARWAAQAGAGGAAPTPTELLGSVPGPGVAPGLVAAHGQALSGEPGAAAIPGGGRCCAGCGCGARRALPARSIRRFICGRTNARA